MSSRSTLYVTVCLGLLAFVPSGLADEKPRKGVASDAAKLDFEPVYFQGQRVVVDGVFEDWYEPKSVRTEALTAGEHEYDWTGPDDLSAEAKVQYNDTHLYAYVRVRDNAFKAPDKKWGADTVDLWFDVGDLALSRGDGIVGLRVDPTWIIGDQALESTWLAPKARKGDAATGVEAAAARTEDGYAIEVAIPFDSIAAAPPTFEPMGFCVVANDWDHDDKREEQASVSTCPLEFARPAKRRSEDFGRVAFDGAGAIWRGVKRNLPEAADAPDLQIRGHVGGDARREVVAIGARRLLVLGAGLGRGEWFAFDLGLTPDDSVLDLVLHDLTGDGTHEMAVTIRRAYAVNGEEVSQDRVVIFDFVDDVGISDPVAEVEIRNQGSDGAYVANELVFGKRKITQKLAEHDGWTRDTYLDADGGFTDAYQPLLLPWVKPKSRTLKPNADGVFAP